MSFEAVNKIERRKRNNNAMIFKLLTSVMASAEKLIHGLADRLAAAVASGDPAKISSIVDSLHASAGSLSAAVAANTVADPIPPPPTDVTT